MGVGLGAAAQYLPPVFVSPLSTDPPQAIIWLPVHTAVCTLRAAGGFVRLVAVQLFVPGLYFPPVLKLVWQQSDPPQTIISLPVHTAVCPVLLSGALVVLVGIQLLALGLYVPPVFRKLNVDPNGNCDSNDVGRL